jgi:hypothetical protein
MTTTVPPTGAVVPPPAPVSGYAVYSSSNYYAGDAVSAIQKYSALDYQLSTINSNASTLQSRVTSAEMKQMQDFALLTSSISSETSRAQTAESSLASSVFMERERALSECSVLRASIVTEKILREEADMSLASSVTAERNRALASESALSSSIVSARSDITALQAGLAQAVATEISGQAELIAVDALIKTAINSVVDGESSLWTAVQNKASIQATNEVYSVFSNFLQVFFSQYNISVNGSALSAQNFLPPSYPIPVPPVSPPLPHPFP